MQGDALQWTTMLFHAMQYCFYYYYDDDDDYYYFKN